MTNDFLHFETRQPHPYDTDPNWQREGACHGMNVNLWFPRRGESPNKILEAKRICQQCPIQQKCLDYSLWHHEKHGIWGGLTELERRNMRRTLGIQPGPTARTTMIRRHPTPDDRCGTYAGWAKHLRNKEKPCEPCQNAKNEIQREYARTRRHRTI